MLKGDFMQINKEPGSYKDPSGAIFHYNDKIYRRVSSGVNQFYQNLVRGDFFQNLVQSNFIVSTWPVDLSNDSQVIKEYGNNAAFFQHERLDFISYPHEWPFAMLKDAALHTLNLQHQLLKNRLSLKDATPYNIQYRFTQPVFIDLCSIEKVSDNGIWIAYNQFCQMFLYPLLKFIFNASDFKGIFLSQMDGLTLNETVESLGFRPVFKYGMLIDYLIPAILTKLNKSKITNITQKTVKTNRSLANSAEIQLNFVHRLTKNIKRMRIQSSASDWKDYAVSCSYPEKDYLLKKKFVEKVFEMGEIKNVIDLGCNTGKFSIIATLKGCDVLALDSDQQCVNSLYLLSKEKKYSIHPLWMDISNPSPAIGWQNTERSDFISRYTDRFNCAFALALIHHLMITKRIPLEQIAKFFSQVTSRFLVVEYVGPEDNMFMELLKYRQENFSHFNMSYFEKVMSTQFITHKKAELIDRQRKMQRCLYLMERRR